MTPRMVLRSPDRVLAITSKFRDGAETHGDAILYLGNLWFQLVDSPYDRSFSVTWRGGRGVRVAW